MRVCVWIPYLDERKWIHILKRVTSRKHKKKERKTRQNRVKISVDMKRDADGSATAPIDFRNWARSIVLRAMHWDSPTFEFELVCNVVSSHLLNADRECSKVNFHLPPKLAQIFPGAIVSSLAGPLYSSLARNDADVAFYFFANFDTTFCFRADSVASHFFFFYFVLNLTSRFTLSLRRLPHCFARCLTPL